MPRITSFDSLPVFGAAAAGGPALAATFPFHRPTIDTYGVVRWLKRMIAKRQAARAVRRNLYALSSMNDRQLRDIGLNRSNIVCAAVEAAGPTARMDDNE
ncbi:MAG: DUF1127 domain-containing protein [Rhodospirillaceae bacterium]|nr:DUF1127 domain-containing protein [Rhodospirillaceae bacterium]MDD9917021.1 DUF1127 domain-containing protein [Rhodospirillaceae bacterium]